MLIIYGIVICGFILHLLARYAIWKHGERKLLNTFSDMEDAMLQLRRARRWTIIYRARFLIKGLALLIIAGFKPNPYMLMRMSDIMDDHQDEIQELKKIKQPIF